MRFTGFYSAKSRNTRNLSLIHILKIISQHADDIREAIFTQLDRGVTVLHGEGGYSHEPEQVLLSLSLIHIFPNYRLPDSVLDDFQYRHLELKGIKVRPNTTIGKTITIDDLFRDGYKSVFIGAGLWKANAMHIKGETLGNVAFGIDYLANSKAFRLGDEDVYKRQVHADLHEVGSGRLVHIQDIADDGIAGHLLCVLVFFLFEHIENIKHDVFPFCLGALTANPAVPL